MGPVGRRSFCSAQMHKRPRSRLTDLDVRMAFGSRVAYLDFARGEQRPPDAPRHGSLLEFRHHLPRHARVKHHLGSGRPANRIGGLIGWTSFSRFESAPTRMARSMCWISGNVVRMIAQCEQAVMPASLQP